jgi:hypothetical protein
MAQPVCTSVQEVGARWSAAQGASVAALWVFAHSVLAFQSANPKVKLAEIGAACAVAVKRASPYGKSWVSRAVKAARAVGKTPATKDEASKFYDLFYGQSATRKAKKSNPSAEDALKAARAFLRRAVKLGLEVDDARAAMTEECDALDSGDEARETAGAVAA